MTLTSPEVLTVGWRVTLNGLKWGYRYDDGTELIVTDLSGWDSLAPTGAVKARANAAGGWASKSFPGPKGLTLKGSVSVGDSGSLRDVLDKLDAALPFDLTTLVVDQDGVSRQMMVCLDAKPTVTVQTTASATVSIPLVAPDPYKYSVAEHSAVLHMPQTTGGLTVAFTAPFTIDATVSGGPATVTNAGTATTYPLLRVKGPVSDPILSNTATGERLSYSGDIADGQYVDIDMQRRTALLNGTATRRARVSGRWWGLQPGSTSLLFTASPYSPDASVLVTWPDVWK